MKLEIENASVWRLTLMKWTPRDNVKNHTENALIPPALHFNVAFFPGHIGMSCCFKTISDVAGAGGGAGQISFSAKKSAGSKVIKSYFLWWH